MTEEIKIMFSGKFVSIASKLVKKAMLICLTILKVLYWLILISLPILSLYYWRFQYSNELLDFLKILTWPFVVMSITFIFKNEISNFINEISELSWGKGKAKRDLALQKQISNEAENLDTNAYDDLEEYKKRSDELTNNLNTLKVDLLQKEIELDFERAYVLIFRSQIYLLNNLKTWGPLTLSFLESIYIEVQKNNPALQSWDFTLYTDFLFRNSFVEIKDDKYTLTQKGNLFLNYIFNIRGYIIDSKLN